MAMLAGTNKSCSPKHLEGSRLGKAVLVIYHIQITLNWSYKRHRNSIPNPKYWYKCSIYSQERTPGYTASFTVAAKGLGWNMLNSYWTIALHEWAVSNTADLRIHVAWEACPHYPELSMFDGWHLKLCKICIRQVHVKTPCYYFLDLAAHNQQQNGLKTAYIHCCQV